MSDGLVLEVGEFTEIAGGGIGWRWILQEQDGRALAHHRVRLEGGDPLLEALTDLPRFLRLNTVPDTRAVEEPKLLRKIGGEVSARILGEVAAELERRGPGPLRVRVPFAARTVAYLPLESAVIAGEHLLARGFSLVWELQPEHPPQPPRDKRPIGAPLRVLALFSLPESASALNLRKERHELTRHLHALTRQGWAIQVRVLQYGTTRERLGEVVAEPEGWHLVHVSGHGWSGGIVLEHLDGSRDWVDTEELVGLLAPLRPHARLVTVSSCFSAGVVVAELRELLGLEEAPDEEAGGVAGVAEAPSRAAPPLLAARLAETLECAVLGMRYPLDDTFATALSSQLYPALLADDQPPGRMLPGAVRAALDSIGGHPPVSAVVPVLFGPVAEPLCVPRGGPPGTEEAGEARAAGLPEPPERFVGRGAVMTRANAALAPHSGHTGVLLHGMAGVGKSTAARELAHLHRENFDGLIWFKAPAQPQNEGQALIDLAAVLERRLGVEMLHHCADESGEALRGYAPDLRGALHDTRALLVLDNVESLLDDDGGWRDPRWSHLVEALTSHDGAFRVVLTSRHPPARLGQRVLAEAVHTLSADEAILLARELPHLGALFTDEEGRVLLRRVLEVTQGHPTLLELADGRANDRGKLAEMFGAADTVWQARGVAPAGFFTRTSRPGEPEDYLDLLATWTSGATRDLPHPARLLLQLLACLEEDDRGAEILDTVWPRLRNPSGPAPSSPWTDTLAELTARGLATTDSRATDTDTRVMLHPAIAATVHRGTGPEHQAAVDRELAVYWSAQFDRALRKESTEATTGALIQAARAAVPYFLRRGETRAIAAALEQILHRDHSPATLAALLPPARALAQAARTTEERIEAETVLARVLLPSAPEEAERRLRDTITLARNAHEYNGAAVSAAILIDHYRDTGRLEEALVLAEERIGYGERAGYGPWLRAGVQTQHLNILAFTGEYATVLEQIQRLLEELEQAPEPAPETVAAWQVREALLNVGCFAARGLERWEEALEFTHRGVESRRRRGASELEIASIRVNAHAPLLMLGRPAEAKELLQECRQVFEDHYAWELLAAVLIALTELHTEGGDLPGALAIGRDALRYTYLAAGPYHIAGCHLAFGNCLRGNGERPAALAHYLAAALLFALIGAIDLQKPLHNLVFLLRHLPPNHPVPATPESLSVEVNQVPGVRLDELVARLATPEQAQETLTRILDAAREAARTHPGKEPS